MAEKLPNPAEFKAEVMKALLASAPDAIDFAEKFDLSPAELRVFIHDAIIHLDGGVEDARLPITTHPPEPFKRMSSTELKMLIGKYSNAKIH